MLLFQGEHLPKKRQPPRIARVCCNDCLPAAQSSGTAMPDHDVELLNAAVL